MTVWLYVPEIQVREANQLRHARLVRQLESILTGHQLQPPHSWYCYSSFFPEILSRCLPFAFNVITSLASARSIIIATVLSGVCGCSLSLTSALMLALLVYWDLAHLEVLNLMGHSFFLKGMPGSRSARCYHAFAVSSLMHLIKQFQKANWLTDWLTN